MAGKIPDGEVDTVYETMEEKPLSKMIKLKGQADGVKYQYMAVPGGINKKLPGGEWEPVDLPAMLRTRGKKHPIIESLSADIIRVTRRDRGWTVAQMGKYLNVSPRTIENWEQGRKVPTAALLLL